jgi:redox-sensitive bicupin YhaK (pirin superfamily)
MPIHLKRREALKLLAAGSAGTLLGCTPGLQEPLAVPEGSDRPAGRTGRDAVLGVAPLQTPWQTEDPFLFCMHHLDRYPAGNRAMGPPRAALAGHRMGRDFEGVDGWRMYHGRQVPGFPRHPHRGFETVTIVRRGLLDHSDSLGATARFGGGDVQWLTAGSGIQHAEMFPLLRTDGPNDLELFQIWLNLPAARKMVDPHFSMLWQPTIPTLEVEDEAGRVARVTVVAGRLGEAVAANAPPASYASEAGSDVQMWTIRLAPHAHFTLPAASRGSRRNLYFFDGAGLRVGGRPIPERHVVSLAAESDVDLTAGSGPVEMVLLGGRPIGEPIARRGPFVMSSEQEIRQAYADYQRTQFGGWPWPSPEPVHERPEGRFALRPDGGLERPG